MNKPFIFTEAYYCSDILKNCLKSFYKYHDDIIHVFGTKADNDNLSEFHKVIFHEIKPNSEVDLCYRFGHLGTARIFSEVINEYSESDDIIHFDSDLIFKQECISHIIDKLNEGFSLVGPVRPYKFNLNNRDDVRSMADVSATCFFGFKKSKILIKDTMDLMYAINGKPFNGKPILDFFDHVSFTIMENGGLFYSFNNDDTGGPDQFGKRNNKYKELNLDIDVGNWYVHFAGIGSGSKLYKKGIESTHKGYADWAIQRYGLYKKLIENIDIANIKVDENTVNLYKTCL